MTADSTRSLTAQARPLHESVSFARLFARTARFTLGVPRSLVVSDDGRRVLFLRSPSGTERAGSLWVYDVDAGQERCVADPGLLLGDSDEELSAAERSRRERSRESGAGIVAYATDATHTSACFALSGRLWLADVTGADRSRPGLSGVRELPATGRVIDPRPDPAGRRVAYASDGALYVVGTDTDTNTGVAGTPLVEPDGEHVVWGQAEFVAAEEMNRLRGFWWAPDGRSLLVERYDESAVPVWHVADPAHPDRAPRTQRYPAAGSIDADVSLWAVGLDGSRVEVGWDRHRFPYLARVAWSEHGDTLLQVLSRNQQDTQVLAADTVAGAPTGSTRVLASDHDEVWLEAYSGVPAWSPDGRLVTVRADAATDTYRVTVEGEPVSPPGLQVSAVVRVDADGVLVRATSEPTELQLGWVGWDGSIAPGATTEGAAVHAGTVAGGTWALTRGGLDADGTQVFIVAGGQRHELTNHQTYAGFRPQVTMLRAGQRQLRTAVLLPPDHVPGSRRLPVVLAPYGGPHGLMCVAASRPFLEAPWLADQGFCVVVADGRGTPHRGPAWDRTVRDDLAGVTLQDQVDALAAVAEAYPHDVDTGRVGITGWSYGGYLSALAVLVRPDVFCCAVAGAPVTDWRLYDTFYTERYFGQPDEQPAVYDANSLLPLAGRLERPLMLIHGLADDNVVAAHTLQLSSALLAAGRPHTVLPLSGVTHLASQEVVAENLKLLQVRFLSEHLGA
ncbi:prolyl oligopeptidase family serine peptidase [soil metagenome]